MKQNITKTNSQEKFKSRVWLRETMLEIQDHIAIEAPELLDRFQRKLHKSEQNTHRNQAQKTITDLKAEQNMIREKLRQIKQLQKTTKPSKRKYDKQFVVKNKSQLRQLTRKYRQFKQNLLQKSRIIQQEEEKQKQKIKILLEQQIKTQCQQRRQKIEDTLKRMEQRRKKRLQQHKLQKLKLKQLRRKKLFEKMKQNFNKKENEINQQNLSRYQRKKEIYAVDISSLSEHQKSYDQIKMQRQEKRSVKMAESRILPEISHYRSRYYDSVLEHDRLERLKKQQIKQRGRIIAQKHKQYQQKVYEDFAPKIKEKNQEQQKQQKKIPLQYQQIKKKGNQYYLSGQKHAIPLQKRLQHEKIKAIQQSMQKSKVQYPDYLKQVLQKVNSQRKTHKKQIFSTQLAKVKQIIRNEKINRQKKLQQVKIFLQKMSFNFEPNKQYSQQQLIQRLNVKMELLQMLK